MNALKMLFVNPACFQGYRYPSLGMLSIAAHLRRHGIPAAYLDCNFHPDWRQKLDALLAEHDTVGVTANVLSIGGALEVSGHVRKHHPGKRIVMGGPYPSIEHDRLIPEHTDLVVVGEGEETMREVLIGAPYETILGLAYGNGRTVANERRPLIPDLDSIPFPAWDLGEPRRYRLPHTRRNPSLPLMTSRGCPFNCIFCGSAIVHRGRIRYRSPENVVAEIDELYNRHGAREIHIWDDNFTLDQARAIEICERIAEKKFRGLLFAIVSGIKPDAGGDELFRAMARAGFYWVCIAFETGDQEIMNRLGKKVKVSKVRDTALAARRAGIYATGFFMLGLPFDNKDTMERTISFACSLPINQAVFFITIPFPGTELYEIAKREGRFLYHEGGELWTQGYFLGRACYEMPGFDAALLERMYRRAYRRFHLRPAQIVRIISGRLRRPIDLWYLVKKGLFVIFRGRQF